MLFVRYTISIVLFLSLLAHTFYQTTIVLSYYVNMAAYAKNCENKNKPMMHCNGKCHMEKKLQQEEKKSQENPERKIEKKFEIISFLVQNFLIEPHYIINSIKYPAFG